MIGIVLFQLGLALAALGLLTAIKPLRWLGVRTRRRAAAVLAAGVFLLALGGLWPARNREVAAPRSLLDEAVPVYQFSEFHETRVDAPPERVWPALLAVTAEEIPLFLPLTWLRRLGRAGPESILNAPEKRPILEVATRTTFVEIARREPEEYLLGTLVVIPKSGPPRRDELASTGAWRDLDSPGLAKAVMNFRLAPDGRGGTLVTTETRVAATDAATRRRFALYWRLIYPGSATIRRAWLYAIAQRAESKGR